MSVSVPSPLATYRGATGMTKRQAAEYALEEQAKRRQARTGEGYHEAYAANWRDPESKPHRAALAAKDADCTATELAKSAIDGIADLRELLAHGVGSYWELVKAECERRTPGRWQDSLIDVAKDFPDQMAKAHAGR
jgi:hypothetical protein